MHRRILLGACLALVACEADPTAPSTVGAVALSIILSGGAGAQLDSGLVHVVGPTNRTIVMAPGSTDTIAGLDPGTYRVVIEGLVSDQVESFGSVPNVQVVAGENTAALIALASFVPAIDSIAPSPTTNPFVLRFTDVPGAVSYLIESDTLAGFQTPSDTSVSDLSASLDVGGFGRHFVRVRAVTEFGTAGVPSAAQQVDVLVTFRSLDVATISVGGFSCGVASDESAYCWGRNQQGQLGNGTLNLSRRPVRVAGGLAFSTVRAGARHACGVTTTGDGYCWGSNDNGQLGVPGIGSRDTPILVNGGLGFSFIDTGSLFSCGITTVGNAYCWGTNTNGELGTGDNIASNVPRLVAGGLTFTTIAVGTSHACAVTSSSEAYCWGVGSSGRLGNGLSMNSNVPVLVSGGAKTSVSPGGGHTCGLNGTVGLCWGLGFQGQLGNGSNVSSTVPVIVTGGLSFAAIASGNEYSCGVTTADVAHCWGFNGSGQLGDGTVNVSLVPVAVAGGLSFTSIGTGNSHTCALTPDGVAYCWGLNNFGQLGDGTLNPSLTPIRVVTP